MAVHRGPRRAGGTAINPVNAQTIRCSGSQCLALVVGIIFILPGFILLMVGYFSTPQIRQDETTFENCRIAGWIILSIGFTLLGFLMGCRAVKDWKRQPTEASVGEQGQVPATEPSMELQDSRQQPPEASVEEKEQVSTMELQSDFLQQSVLHPSQQPITSANTQPLFLGDLALLNRNSHPLPEAVDDVHSTGGDYKDQALSSYTAVTLVHSSVLEPEDVAI